MGEVGIGNFYKNLGIICIFCYFFLIRDEFNVLLSMWEGIREKIWGFFLLVFF